jgi:hypothetical protein
LFNHFLWAVTHWEALCVSQQHPRENNSML